MYSSTMDVFYTLLLPSEAKAATYSWRRLQFLLVPDPRATYVF
jgi:hypothetical protein